MIIFYLSAGFEKIKFVHVPSYEIWKEKPYQRKSRWISGRTGLMVDAQSIRAQLDYACQKRAGANFALAIMLLAVGGREHSKSAESVQISFKN